MIENPPVGLTTLGNGIRVVTESHPYFKSAAVGFFVNRGSRDESKSQMGMCHLIEHMVFKGTKKRSVMQIAESLECVGGDLNAFTSKEQTCFHGLALKKDLPKILDVLSDLLVNGIFDPKDLELEKAVVAHEIQMSADQLEDFIFDMFFEEFYKGSSMHHPILGTEESLERISRDQIIDFYSQHYAGSQVVIAGSGAFTHDEFVNECAMHLEHLKPYNLPKLNRILPQPHAFTKLVSKPSEQVHVLIGVPSIDFSHKLKTTGIVFNLALGAGMTSHLYQKIREEKGMAYTVFSALQMFQDCGILFLYAGTAIENFEQVLNDLTQETKNFIRTQMTDDKLEFFKNQLIGQLMIASDDVENRMHSIGTNEQILGRYRGVNEVINEVRGITQKDMLEFCTTGLDFSKASLIVVGDLETERTNIEKLMNDKMTEFRK